MRVQPVSDLHLEFDEDHGERFALELPVLGDVLVLAGDVLPLRRAPHIRTTLGWFCNRFPRVIYVPGNHEYYRTTPRWASGLLTSCAREFPNLHVLDAAVTEIDGVRFVGATLWFPPTPDEPEYRRFLADFTFIQEFVPWVHETHAAHLAFLEQTVQRGDVVITHFVPHERSVAPQYQGSPLNRFFIAGDATPLVERAGARLWNPRAHPHLLRLPGR